MKYYFLGDTATQWFWYAVAFDEQGKLVEKTSIQSGMEGDFIKSIVSRDFITETKRIENKNYSGYSISQWEFNKLKRLAELYPLQSEYHNLLKLV